MNKYAITTQGLKKKYGWSKEAVKGIDLQVPKGSVYVFLGRNGAGKTTTIKMLMGLLGRTSGNAEVLGFDPEKDPVSVRSKVGYVSENQKMYDWMTIGELIWFNKSFYQTWDEKLVNSLLSRFKLTKDLKLKNLSRGMYAQIALILALAQGPDLLILDDPISGLDPVVRREFMESIIEILHEKERTVFFSTHIVNEVEKLADRVGIMHDGNLLVSMPTEELKNNVKKIRMLFDDKIPEDLVVPGLLKKESSGHEASVIVKDFKKELLDEISNKYKPKSSEIQTLTIEDIFVTMVG
jgi:ABC-2 type transport system ATP-binding protein